MTLMEIITAIGRKAGAWAHDRAVQGILDTPPIVAQDDGVILFSMIGTAVLLPYLVAVKSLHHHLPRGKIVLLDDGTLTVGDKQLLARHCDNPEIIGKQHVDTSPCPRDNCWERLISILDRRHDHYVIQLDSDTVTTGPVPEIAAAISANRSFTLAGGLDEAQHGFKSAREISQIFHANGPTTDHVQAHAEAAMKTLPEADSRRYIRGCAGFAGFAKSSDGRATVAQFSEEMDARLGDTWRQWGSEQVASNWVVANDPDPIQLPYDRYINHWDEPMPKSPAFVHYIGTYRYRWGNYSRTTREAIAALKA
ncbi:MAG: hypothetical protein ACK4SJ_12970 [Sphingorhabdus sp.]